jgi:UPF0271 protein
MGESFGIYQLADDRSIIAHIDLSNIACGFHASDFNHMRRAVQLAKEFDVPAGAHPSLPDRQGFGRREMVVSREELANCLIYQIGALTGMLAAEGVPLNHIKPHGALYGMTARSPDLAHAVCDAADVFRVPILGMVGTCHESVFRARGHELIPEFFADLEYGNDGNTIIHHHITDSAKVAERTVRAVREGMTRSVDGHDIHVVAETICVHSDNANAVEIVKAISAALASERRSKSISG